MSFNISHVRTQSRVSTWNVDEGYNTDVKDQEHYPFRVIDAGLQYSLFVILKTKSHDIDYLCGGSIQGFNIGFHSPGDIPRGRKHFVSLSPNRAAFYSIEPRLMQTEARVRKFDPHHRQCYFNTERKLRFYQHYTRIHCMAECMSNFTLTQCGCVRFSMLRMYNVVANTNKLLLITCSLGPFTKFPYFLICYKIDSNGTKVCGTVKLACIRKSIKIFYNNEESIECDCLPSCSELTYNAIASTTGYDFTHTLSHSVHNKNMDLEK